MRQDGAPGLRFLKVFPGIFEVYHEKSLVLGIANSREVE